MKIQIALIMWILLMWIPLTVSSQDTSSTEETLLKINRVYTVINEGDTLKCFDQKGFRTLAAVLTDYKALKTINSLRKDETIILQNQIDRLKAARDFQEYEKRKAAKDRDKFKEQRWYFGGAGILVTLLTALLIP